VSAAAFASQAWYPVLVADAASVHTFDGDIALGALSEAWSRRSAGDALVLVDRARHVGERVGRVLRPGRAARLLARMPEATRVDRWYILPGTGGSHTLLPRSAAGFASGTGFLPGGRPIWRVAREVLRRGARLAPGLGLDELVIATKGSSGPPRIAGLAGRGTQVALSLGVPGPVRKAVARAVDARGQVLGVAKLPLTPHARERIQHEGDAMAALRDDLAPRLIDRDDDAWLWMEDLNGRRSGDHLGPEHTELLARLTVDAAAVPIGEVQVYRSAIRKLAVSPPRDRALALALEELSLALRAVAEQELVCAAAHGDFTPWNIVHTAAGLRAFDWEFHLAQAPALFDPIHFILQTAVLVEHVAPRELFACVQRACAGALAAYLRRLSIDAHDVPMHLALYLLHQAMLDDGLHRIERPTFAQVDWLRDARLELARRVTRELGGVRQKVGA
jgi:hypothetical protein